MVKHIVVWRVKDTPVSKLANAQEIKRLLEGMRGKIPGVLKLEVGINFVEDPLASDCVLYSEFADRAALLAYQTHPVHEAVKAGIRELSVERRVADYDC
jgi:quinol monooxygenase YgiN